MRVTWLGALATVDLLACGREHPPGAAELVDALAGRLTRLAVGHEVVERVAVVGDLEPAVLALGRAEQRRAHARAGDRPRRGVRFEVGCERPGRHSLPGRARLQRDAA